MPQGQFWDFSYLLCAQSLSTVICQSGHSFNFFADDSQLHNSSNPSDFPALVHSLKDGIEDVAEWMGDSMLKMNNDKTELIAIGTKPKISQVTISLIPVSDLFTSRFLRKILPILKVILRSPATDLNLPMFVSAISRVFATAISVISDALCHNWLVCENRRLRSVVTRCPFCRTRAE